MHKTSVKKHSLFRHNHNNFSVAKKKHGRTASLLSTSLFVFQIQRLLSGLILNFRNKTVVLISSKKSFHIVSNTYYGNRHLYPMLCHFGFFISK